MKHFLKNNITKEVVILTQKELNRFFDNRDPSEWDIL